MAVWGDLSLDRLDKKDVTIWAPKLTNPFATRTKLKETKVCELYVKNVMIAHSSWEKVSSLDRFVIETSKGILQTYQARIDPNNLRKFFSEVHEHYMDYFRNPTLS